LADIIHCQSSRTKEKRGRKRKKRTGALKKNEANVQIADGRVPPFADWDAVALARNPRQAATPDGLSDETNREEPGGTELMNRPSLIIFPDHLLTDSLKDLNQDDHAWI